MPKDTGLICLDSSECWHWESQFLPNLARPFYFSVLNTIIERESLYLTSFVTLSKFLNFFVP